MAFAILLNTEDLQYIASQLTRPDLDTTDTLNAAKMWDGGLRNHGASPQPQYQYLQGDPEMRIVAMQTNNMSSSAFVAAMRAMAFSGGVAKYPATQTLQDSIYMDALSQDIASNLIEPYNG